MNWISEWLPWKAHNLAIRVPRGFWAFNPSVLRTPDGRWLCAIRFANYHMSIDAHEVPRSPIVNRNLMAVLDPASWKIRSVREICELDGHSRFPAHVAGYDDVRLTWTDDDGLCAIANTAQLSPYQRREIVTLDFDERYQIIGAHPLRGPWSKLHQKNWTPYTGTKQLRLLYSIERGGIHLRSGRLLEPHPTRRPPIEALEIIEDKLPVLAGGDGLTMRGGTQLIALGDGRWLGLGHMTSYRLHPEPGETTASARGYHYWHVFYTVDVCGHLLDVSDGFKIENVRIEFAAGLALDPDSGALVISYGIDDERSMIGITELDAVLERLKPAIPSPEPVKPEPRQRSKAPLRRPQLIKRVHDAR